MASSSNFLTVESVDQYKSFVSSVKDSGALVVSFFWASWHEPSKLLLQVVSELAKEQPSVKFAAVEAEAQPDVTALHSQHVTSVPTFVFVRRGQVTEVLEGAVRPAVVAKAVQRHANQADQDRIANTNKPSAPVVQKEDLNTRLAKLVQAAPVMIFMKGDPTAPQCGFSRKMIAVLKEQNVQFGFFDILTDNVVRQGLKTFSNWPTFPQLYIDGKLIGGLDVVTEMIEDGEFKDVLPKEADASSLKSRLASLISSSRVMLFMKGEPGAPKCGFSRQTVAILNDAGFEYGHFDILSDQSVRQGLKSYSNWPTFPQLYVEGKLIGGLDIIKELAEDGELEDLKN